MKNYTECVKALRYCMAKEDGITICEPCPYYDKGIDCENVLHTDAAAAIEGLIESVYIRDKVIDELNQHIWKLEAAQPPQEQEEMK